MRWCRARAICSYEGDLDAEGRPHGIGRWRDTQPKGETLMGKWHHGVPVGPFVASVQGSGFSVRCVQIGFATCCEQPLCWDENRGASLVAGELHWGVRIARLKNQTNEHHTF